MKSYKLFTLLILFFSISCTDENATCDVSNQNLQGQISGGSWSAGEARATTYTDGTQERLDVVIFTSGNDPSDLCAETGVGIKRVFFNLPNEIGNRPLKLDLNDNEGSQTITLFDPNAAVSNDLSTVGCVEIISITSTIVEMAIKASSSLSNIEGNVTLSLCN